ncbi:hypothetical protein A1F96_03621, partial [Pyrenophora tritici-repentis]
RDLPVVGNTLSSVETVPGSVVGGAGNVVKRGIDSIPVAPQVIDGVVAPVVAAPGTTLADAIPQKRQLILTKITMSWNHPVQGCMIPRDDTRQATPYKIPR